MGEDSERLNFSRQVDCFTRRCPSDLLEKEGSQGAGPDPVGEPNRPLFRAVHRHLRLQSRTVAALSTHDLLHNPFRVGKIWGIDPG